ncbi:hypothetical protein B0H13DRAFT_2348394 [Mycena leptocephala]|nr:hypothetical protein B0H13DRAFT_2348394 [Mycena leptocephala]
MNDNYRDLEFDSAIEEYYRRQILVDDEVSPLEVLDTSIADLEEYANMTELFMKVTLILARFSRWIYPRFQVPIVAVGLQSDRFYEREVDAATIKSLSTQWNISFYEASAKLNWHVDDVFEDLIRQLREKYPPPPDPVMKRGKWQQESCIIM